ncbi:TetR family transcriptional regulator [Agromyces sp. MMS24-JH15]|uniref:TetR family transcriptional regulator n=1 Tax=Agromyces sp. MMS24-JH15 TaxID=3243765 RepID=UPI00374884DE
MPASGKEVPANPKRRNRGPSAGPENRRALIAAAREVFAADGFDAPLNAVAKRAGVGQGSLYRHFPDRVALAVAVFDENIDAIEAAVEPPDATLDTLLDLIVEQAVVSSALIDAVWRNRHDERAVHMTARLEGIAQTLVERERAAGHIGAHVDTADVLLAISMLADVLARSDAPERADAAERATRMFHAAFAPRP